MARSRSIRSRRGRKRINEAFELNITSLLDVLVIILVFIMKSFSASLTTFNTVPGLELPMSKSPDIPHESLHVILTPEAITFENERIVEFIQSAESLGNEARYTFSRKDLDEGGNRIVPLFDALTQAKQKSELLRSKSQARTQTGEPLPFEGILAIQADKRVHYDTVRRVMYTAGAAGFKTFRFLAQQDPAGNP